jgi:hypothetical protein
MALSLPQVTLCAATSVNVTATIMALERCRAACRFARVLLFTDRKVPNLQAGIEVVAIAPLRSARDYSHFVLHRMVEWIDTSHCLIAQWDGFVLNAGAWDPAFLDHDYIGAPWPQFDDGYTVGNGGFSLRSKRLMEACNALQFADSGGAEDVVLARENRAWLEQAQGLSFADEMLAARFSFERSGGDRPTFGFHGAFNLPRVLGVARFWDIYRTLDETASLDTDFWTLCAAVARGPHGLSRAAHMVKRRI